MSTEPHLVIRRPSPPEDRMLPVIIGEMRIELLRSGMRWAEFLLHETGEIVARGWPDRPEGAVATADQEPAEQ